MRCNGTAHTKLPCAARRGIIFYLVCAMIMVALILGTAFLFFLRSEARMITHTQKNEVLTYLAEAAANEAFFIIRLNMNTKDNDVFNMLRVPGTQPTNYIGIPLNHAKELAGEYNADIEGWASYVNRQAFTKDLFSRKEIPGEQQDPRETYGSLQVIVEAEYRGLKKRLIVHRDVKVFNPYPPKGDFSLWVKNAAADTLNPWLSQVGLQTKCLRIFNGPDDKPPYDENADIFLGGGAPLELTKLPGSELLEHVGIPDSTFYKSFSKPKPIIINITGEFPFGRHGLFHYLGAPIAWNKILKKLDWMNMVVPNEEKKLHTAGEGVADGLNESLPPANKRSAYQMVGHDLVLEETEPITIHGIFGSKELEEHAGLKYYFRKESMNFQGGNPNDENNPANIYLSVNDVLGPEKSIRRRYLDITKSGLDLFGIDYPEMKFKPEMAPYTHPQYPRGVYGHVYKSLVRLRATDIGDQPGGIALQGAWFASIRIPENRAEAFVGSGFFKWLKRHSVDEGIPVYEEYGLLGRHFHFLGLKKKKVQKVVDKINSKIVSFDGSWNPELPPENLQPIIDRIQNHPMKNRSFSNEKLKEKLMEGDEFIIREIKAEEFEIEKARQIRASFDGDGVRAVVKQPGTIWGITPWRSNPSGFALREDKMDVLDLPDYIDPEGTPHPQLLTPVKPRIDDQDIPGWLENPATYTKYMTQVVQSPYDWRGQTRLKYTHRVRGYEVDVEQWSDPDRHLEELSWNKISRSFGRFDDFKEACGLSKYERGEEAVPHMRLDGIWLIADIDRVRFPKNTTYTGKGTLVFLNTNVIIDGMMSKPLWDDLHEPIKNGRPFPTRLFAYEQRQNPDFMKVKPSLSIVLLSFGRTDRKIFLSNRFVEASLCAPTSSVELKVGARGKDSQGENRLDIDVQGNLVVNTLRLGPYSDNEGLPPLVGRGLDLETNEDMKTGGGTVRWDPFMIPPRDGDEYDITVYRAALSRRISYWNLSTVTGEDD